ncbi:InlB B-repeat-containing protein [[Clostridium] fimetarium]|nr:InlB B-repeat-containing protein [[Clostridium] fimetarium]
MKKLMLKIMGMKKWMLYAAISICIVVSVSVAVMIVKPWKDNSLPANTQKDNTVQVDKENKDDKDDKDSKDDNSNPSNNSALSDDASISNDLRQLDNVGGSNNLGTPDNSIRLSSLTFTLRFESNGGSTIEDRLVRGETKLEDLPIPYKSGTIFMGWYYDVALKNRVSHNDQIKSDITLYAKYAEAASLAELETPRFATMLDQATSFSFVVFAPAGMSAEQVKLALITKNVTNPKQTDFIEVTGSNGFFTVSAKGGKFESGATYKFSLDDESLSYEGFGTSVRDYNFTTAKAEVLNLGLNDSIIYIATEDVSNMTLDGEGVSSLSIPLATTDLGTIDYKSGTFTYDKAALAIGNNIAIYKGLRPDLRGLNDTSSEGEVAYIKVTEVNGTTYNYKNAEAEEILFTPDVFPINNTADMDGDQNNHSVTVVKSSMDFSNGAYASVGLDEKTTIDVGDYIVFYSGQFDSPTGSATYSKISTVRNEGENIIITYVDATIDEVVATMDVYDTEGVNGDTLLEGVSKESLEADIEQQASTSGFAEEAAKYLAALTLETDAFTQMDGDFDLDSYNIELSDGTPLTKDQVQLMDGKKVEVELTELKATISTDLKHFEGLSGLRCTLKVVVEIKISTGEESEIVIAITGYFEQEVRIATNCSGAAIWKWWGIFPYIDEYQLNATIDLYDYTGISIEATIATKEKSEEYEFDTSDVGQNIAKQLKALIDAKDKYVGDGEDTVTDGLCDKYAAMLENESDWVELFSKEIFSKSGNIGPFGVIAYEIDFKFVVTANMNITIGCDFYYENAKRYNYSIGVFGKTCTNETIDLVEEHYEFTFYVMGTMGLRAGVKFEFKVGVFSTKLASVGISAEVGAYVRVWGYFYYELSYTASTGKHSKWSGALLFELGIYLEIKFEAQAFSGTFSYNPTLYENEWPLWSAGSRENVQAFAELEDDDPEIALKKHLRTAVVPDDYFKMSYLDLKTGDVDEKSYDDEKCFNIEITNSAFSYDTASNIMKMVPDGDQVEVGQMVITWINAPLAFTSEPIQRTIDLYWDNYNDGYAIVFNSNGGSAVPTIMKSFNAEIIPPTNPNKTGYDFGGWYRDAALTQAYSIPATMPDSDVEVFAKWNPRSDTKYTVEHYQQNLNNNIYTLVDTDSLQGKTDSKVKPATKSYEGFTAPSLYDLTILPDGSAVQKYYYSRNSYTLTFEQNIENGQSDWVYNLKYGANITVPKLTAIGYEFTGWNLAVAEAMLAKNLVYTAQWAAGKDTPYLIEHYIQNTNEDSYTLQTAEYRSGETNTIITLNNLKVSAEGIMYQQGSVKGKLTQTATISKDGKLVVKLYYLRNSYKANTQVENGVNDSVDYRYEAVIGEPAIPSRVGYTFSGWYKDILRTTPFVFGNAIMPASDIIIYGKLIPKVDTTYQVEHYVEQTNGSFMLQDMDNLAGTTDTSVILSDLIKKDLLVTGGISFKEGKVGSEVATTATISGDGKLVIKLYYQRENHSLTFKQNNGKEDIVSLMKYAATVTAPTGLTKTGYSFNGWDSTLAVNMSNVDMIYTAQWASKTDTAYVIHHIRQSLDGTYPASGLLVETENKTGITDANTTAAAKNYEGFTSNIFVQTKIAADGSTVVEIRYSRNRYTVTWKTDETTYSSTDFKYGETITPPVVNPIKTGYNFYTWNGFGEGAIMPTNGLTYSAQWTAATNTAYTVKYLNEELDGSYIVESTEIKYGTTNANTAAVAKVYTGFIVGTVTQSAIAADGSTVVEIRYSRNSYTVTWMSDSDTFKSETLKYKESIIVPATNPTKFGYDFKGWGAIALTMPANNISYSAIWEGKKHVVTFAYNDGTENSEAISQTYGSNYVLPESTPIRAGYAMNGWYTIALGGNEVDGNTIMRINLAHKLYAQWVVGTNTKYVVKHYQQNVEDNEYTQILEDAQSLNGVTDANTNAVVKIYSGFTAQSFSQLVINGDGSTVVEIYYNRNPYTLTFIPDNGSQNIVSTVTYGAKITDPVSPEKIGYTFGGWGTVASSMPASNVSYAAIWTANTYTVTFDVNGGVLSNNSKVVTYDSTYGELPDPTRTGYTFGGWYTTKSDGSNIVANTTVVITNDQTLFAHWTANTYTVTLDVNGGDVLADDSKSVTYDSTYGILPEVSRTGYTFSGWYTAISGGNKIVETDQVSIIAGQRLYARWTANEYAIAFNGNNATSGSMNNQGMAYDLNENLNLNTFARTGYRFVGWATTSEGAVVYSDGISVLNLTATNNGTVTLFAQWTIESYSITFNSNGGSSVLAIIGRYYNAAISAPSAPTRSAYEFGGWYTDSSFETLYIFDLMPANSFQLYAKWTALNYGIHYELNSGTNHANNSSIYSIESANITLGSPTRSDYTFEGWYTEGTFVNKVEGTAIANGSTGEKTFYAKWTAVVYTINYSNLSGAGNTNSATYTVESDITVVAPSNRTGYTFGGWYDNASYNGAIITSIAMGSSGNKNLYAKWSTISYSINYVLNSGINDNGNLSSYNIESTAITLANPTRTAYNFDGWYTDSSFINKVTGVAISSGNTGDKTFYAKWTPVNYSIQYQLNGGTGGKGNPNSYTIQSSTISFEAPTRSGYIFAGWFDNSSFTGSSVGTLSNGSMENKTYYAKWTVITYTITYNLNGGTNGVNPTTYTVESATIALQNPTKGVDDVFAGWYTNSSFTGTAVTHITNGNTGNVDLYAKWINYGSFTVSNNGNNTFTITRAGGTDGAQIVYFKTQNGSAISGTQFASANGIVTFAQGETTKTITITEYSVTSQYGSSIATSYSNADRVYFFDIYKVDGGGKLDSGIRATRTMAKNSNYTIDATYLNDYRQIASVNSKNQQIYENAGGSYAGTVSIGLSSPVLNNSAFSSNLQGYIEQTASGMKVKLVNFTGKDDGWRMYRFVLFNTIVGNVSFSSNKGTNVPNLPTNTKCALVYGITADQNNTDNYSVQLAGNAGSIAASGTSNGVSINSVLWASGQDTGAYVLYDMSETCGITVGAYNSATQNSSWWFDSASLSVCPKDVKEPSLVAVAPMASTTFTNGDKVVVSLVFDEIVNSADNVSITTPLSGSAFTLVGGLGTNVLYFEGTVTNNGCSTPTTSGITIHNSANIKDMCN